VLQLLGGEAPRPNSFPPQNPVQGVPTQRINMVTYLSIARALISNNGEAQVIQQVPGAETPALITELGQYIREVNCFQWLQTVVPVPWSKYYPQRYVNKQVQNTTWS
jgi:hypothetical protein